MRKLCTVKGIMQRRQIWYAATIFAYAGCIMAGANSPEQSDSSAPAQGTDKSVKPSMTYILGPADQIDIWALGAEELSGKPLRIDAAGYVDVPTVGPVKAGGLTLEQLKAELIVRLKSQLKNPQVSVSIVSYGSEPVSVIGAVNKPGVYQLEGPRTLLEVLSLAGGVSNDAGSTVRVVRKREPDPQNTSSTVGAEQASVTTFNLQSIVEGDDTTGNILIRPNDVISVSRAKVVYVAGSVHKPGGFPLGERDQLSIIQLMSLAEGL